MATNTKSKGKLNNKVVKKSNMKPKKGYIAFLMMAVVMFVIILISTVFSDIVQIYNNEKESKILEKRRTDLLEEEASLNSEVIKLQDPDYIARYAREKYLYTKDGEKILTIIDGSEVNNKSSVEEKKDENSNEQGE